MKRAHDRRKAYEKARGIVLDDDLDVVAAMGPAGMLIARDFRDSTIGVPRATRHASKVCARKFASVVGDRGALDIEALDAFHRYLEGSDYSPSHKMGLYAYAKRCITRLVAAKAIEPFRVPRRYHAGQVISVTPPPKRLIDGLQDVPGVGDGELLESIVDFAYSELETWRRKRRLGEALVDAVRPAYDDLLERTKATGREAPLGLHMDTEWIEGFRGRHGTEMAEFGMPVGIEKLVAFAYCLVYTLDRHDGFVRTRDAVVRLMEGGALLGQHRYFYARGKLGRHGADLLISMVGPGLPEAAALSVLLAAAHVNPESIPQIRADCLKPTANPNMFVLSWTKGRSGGAMPGLGFPTDAAETIDVDDGVASRRILPARGIEHRDRSIPFAVADYVKASARFRAAAGYPDSSRGEPDPRALLMLAQSVTTKVGNEFRHSVPTMNRYLSSFGERFALHLRERHPGIGNIPVTLGKVRVSALNHFHRSSGSLKATSFAAQHVSPRTTAHYIRNRDTMDSNSDEIRRISTEFEAAVRSRSLVLVDEASAPDGTVDVGHGMSCTDRLWGGMPGQKVGSPCEFFVGCLSCEKAIVVASALNHARLTKYRDHLHASHDRRNENPERWDRWIAPRLAVLDAALLDFPPEIASAGRDLSKRLRIEFGAIW